MNITLGQLGNFIITFGAVLTAGKIICKSAFKSGKKILDKALAPFDERIDKIEKTNKERDIAIHLQMDKNYLVRFLADVEQGAIIDETELEHFWFTYDDYKKNGGNSYIDHKVERLKKEGKL